MTHFASTRDRVRRRDDGMAPSDVRARAAGRHGVPRRRTIDLGRGASFACSTSRSLTRPHRPPRPTMGTLFSGDPSEFRLPRARRDADALPDLHRRRPVPADARLIEALARASCTAVTGRPPAARGGGVPGRAQVCQARRARSRLPRRAPDGLSLAELIGGVNERLDEPWPSGLDQELVYSLHGHAERQTVHSARNADGRIIYRATEQS